MSTFSPKKRTMPEARSTPNSHATQTNFTLLRPRLAEHLLRAIDSSSGTGPDHLPGRILKTCARSFALPVCLLARLIFSQALGLHLGVTTGLSHSTKRALFLPQPTIAAFTSLLAFLRLLNVYSEFPSNLFFLLLILLHPSNGLFVRNIPATTSQLSSFLHGYCQFHEG
jgi:hypothetical protein